MKGIELVAAHGVGVVKLTATFSCPAGQVGGEAHPLRLSWAGAGRRAVGYWRAARVPLPLRRSQCSAHLSAEP